MNRFLTAQMPVWNAEGAGGGTAPAAPADGAPPAAAPADGAPATPATALTPNAPADAPADGQDAPADGTTSEADPADPAGQEAEGFTLTPPEGMEQFGDQFKAFADDMDGWLKENPDATAKDALQEAANRQAQSVAQQQEQAQSAFQEQITNWEGEAKADKEVGGPQFDENVATAVKALDAYGTPELRDVLQKSGLGSHPEMIRFAFRAGKALAEPGIATGATAQQPRSFTERIYSGNK